MSRAPTYAVAFALFLVGVPSLSGANAPSESLRPVTRPADAQSTSTLQTAMESAEVATESETKAPTKDDGSATGSEQAVVASLRPEARPKGLVQQLASARSEAVRKIIAGQSTGAKGAICGDADIIGRAIAPIAAKMNGCGLEEGVSVIAVAGVALTAPASIDCKTAHALKSWVATGVKPAIGRKGGGVAALQVAASYACRGRNNIRGARVSEHGRGKAIDISAILLANGSRISVLEDWGTGADGKALKAMRGAACGPFNTVLGPGSDRHHADHFHFDTATRRGPYCR